MYSMLEGNLRRSQGHCPADIAVRFEPNFVTDKYGTNLQADAPFLPAIATANLKHSVSLVFIRSSTPLRSHLGALKALVLPSVHCTAEACMRATQLSQAPDHRTQVA